MSPLDPRPDAGRRDDPAVSLIVITRNHERYIDQALDSVARQTLRGFHVVIVDDCSIDGNVERIRQWLARAPVSAELIANDRNLGMCRSRNLALSRCRGEFVCALSGDDYYEPDRLERQLQFFSAQDRSVAAVFGRTRVVDEGGHELGVWFEGVPEVPEGRIFERLLHRNFIPAPAVMVRRAAIDAVGGYDESLFFEDYDMWLRIAERYRFRYQPRIVSNYRLLESGASRNPAYWGPMNESRVRILLKWFGHSDATDDVVIAAAWKFALSAFAADPDLGRTALQRVYECRPTPWGRAVLLAASLRDSHVFASRAFRFVQRRRARGRRTPNGRVILP